jgi:hypothetical protein
MEIPEQFFESAKNVLNILWEAKDDKKHVSENDITHEMEIANITDSNGNKVQIVLKLIVDETEFLERGTIVSRTDTDRQKIPYKTILPKGN